MEKCYSVTWFPATVFVKTQESANEPAEPDYLLLDTPVQLLGAAVSRGRLHLLVVSAGRKWSLKNCDALRGPQWKLDAMFSL